MLPSATIDTPLGPMVAVAATDGLAMLEFDEPHRVATQIALVERRFDDRAGPGASRWIESVRDELREYFAGSHASFSTPLALRGTEFQLKVWRRLLIISTGQTLSYGKLAAEVGGSPRAIGGAVGSNPIAILVPCHRVVRADGDLCGYAGGLDRKRRLLQLEGVLAQAGLDL